MKPLRICVIGDELVTGLGDARGLGWLGRVLARTQLPADLQVFPLAVPGETTSALSARWQAECGLRFASHCDNRLIIQVGMADLEAGIIPARTRLNLANILDSALDKGITPLVVGPPPLDAFDSRGLAQIAKAAKEVCERRSVVYVDTYNPLLSHDQWRDDLAVSPTNMPTQTGYALLAWIVLHCGWFQWIGLNERA